MMVLKTAMASVKLNSIIIVVDVVVGLCNQDAPGAAARVPVIANTRR
jgi:hypothetical protein